jgi:hypothetical protein
MREQNRVTHGQRRRRAVERPAAPPSLLDRSSDFAEDQAVGAVQRTAEGLVPFRGWVRKLSGAERYSKKVSASITAGSVRRAFSKGFAAAQHCPASPSLQTAAVAERP